MKGFFRNMSFPRAVILFCSLGSIALGTVVYLRTKRLDEVLQELRRAPDLVREIQTDAYRLSELQKTATAEQFKAQSEPETYIRAKAGDDKINMGQIDISHTTKSPARGIEDTVYKISPQLKTQRFSRGQIGNFAWKLEFDSRRVKVTRLKLTPFDKTTPGEVGKDLWTYEIELTTRSKTDSASG